MKHTRMLIRPLVTAATAITVSVLLLCGSADALVYMPVADDIIKSCGESVDDKRCIFVLNDPINSMKEGRIYFDFRSCIPSGITYSQLRTVIVDYLISYPEKGKISYQIVIGAAISEAYPCPPNPHYKLVLRDLDNTILERQNFTADTDNVAISSAARACDNVPKCATSEVYQRGDLLSSLGGGPAMMAMFKEARTYKIVLRDSSNAALQTVEYEDLNPGIIVMMGRLCYRLAQCEKAEVYQKDILVFSKSRSEMATYMPYDETQVIPP